MKRIQRSRAKGWRMPPNAIYVGRPTVFGNPFRPTDRRPQSPSDQLRRVENFRAWVTGSPKSPWFGTASDEARQDLLSALPRLRGRDLACWCPLPPCPCLWCRSHISPCHADVLLELANR